MKNLYELTSQYMQLQDLIESGEFDAQVLSDTLEAVEGEIEVKAENYGLVIKNLESQVTAIKNEVDRLNNYKKSVESGIKHMKNALSNAMIATDTPVIKTDHFRYSFRKSESIKITDADLIPDELVNIVVEKKPDKVAIKKAIKAGKDIKGAILEEKKNLQVK